MPVVAASCRSFSRSLTYRA
ncbi:MAG: hypothetical protein ACRD1W_04335, partial [Vicinamibacterales bacterium]